MDFLEAKHTAGREIALAFGVPPMLLGIPGDNTYSNDQEANRVLFRSTVLPLARRIADALSLWLAPAFGGAARLAVDLDSVPALAADRAALREQVTRASFLTVNETRAMTGSRRSRSGPVGVGDAKPTSTSTSVICRALGSARRMRTPAVCRGATTDACHVGGHSRRDQH